ncbi:MAG: hypothetical protein F4186_15150 [Boseongicola sp. SB0676_bin_33]|nr:hypothetical protein [Boseongicola sp. SB0676_bin_33]
METALADLARIGPGGHFFDEDYTRAHMPFLDEVQDNERYETWVAGGSKSVGERGCAWCRNMLERYEDESPPLDDGVRDALREYVVRREVEIPGELV